MSVTYRRVGSHIEIQTKTRYMLFKASRFVSYIVITHDEDLRSKPFLTLILEDDPDEWGIEVDSVDEGIAIARGIAKIVEDIENWVPEKPSMVEGIVEVAKSVHSYPYREEAIQDPHDFMDPKSVDFDPDSDAHDPDQQEHHGS